MREINVGRVIRTRPAGNHEFLRRQGFDRTVVALQREGVFVNKMRITLQYFTVVALIKALPHARLLINDVIGMVENIGKGRTK